MAGPRAELCAVAVCGQGDGTAGDFYDVCSGCALLCPGGGGVKIALLKGDGCLVRPADGEVVTACFFPHEGLEVVALTGSEGEGFATLSWVFVPFIQICPACVMGIEGFLEGGRSFRKSEFALVVRSNEEGVIAGNRGLEGATQTCTKHITEVGADLGRGNELGAVCRTLGDAVFLKIGDCRVSGDVVPALKGKVPGVCAETRVARKRKLMCKSKFFIVVGMRSWNRREWETRKFCEKEDVICVWRV